MNPTRGEPADRQSARKGTQLKDGEVEESMDGVVEKTKGGDTEPGHRGGNRSDGMAQNETRRQHKLGVHLPRLIEAVTSSGHLNCQVPR